MQKQLDTISDFLNNPSTPKEVANAFNEVYAKLLPEDFEPHPKQHIDRTLKNTAQPTDQKTIDETISSIAHKHLGLETLEERKSDSLDFSNQSVWSIKNALTLAYMAGQQDKTMPIMLNKCCIAFSNIESMAQEVDDNYTRNKDCETHIAKPNGIFGESHVMMNLLEKGGFTESNVSFIKKLEPDHKKQFALDKFLEYCDTQIEDSGTYGANWNDVKNEVIKNSDHLKNKATPTLQVQLNDNSDATGKTKLKTTIKLNDIGQIEIYPQCYGCCNMEEGHGSPLLLELWEGKLSLRVFDDINEENCKSISLESAKESNRKAD